VARADWVDPEAVTPSAARSATRVRGYRRTDSLRRLNGASGVVSNEMVSAADQLRLLYDGMRLGFVSGLRDLMLPVTAIVYRPSMGPTRTAMRQTNCERKFRRCWRIFNDGQRAIIEAVVLGSMSLHRWRTLHGIPQRQAMELLLTTLELLVEYFHSELDRHGLSA
jgi:hypothetical protein